MADEMPQDRFWQLISGSVTANEDGSVDASALRDALASLPTEEVVGFAHRLDACFSRSRTWALWGAAELIHDGAPDDTFDYFRSWLIGRGRAVFEAAMRDPDSLADVATSEALDDVVYDAADVAYRDQTGGEPPWEHPAWPELGEPPDFSDEEAMKRRYPKLYARFRGLGS